MPIRLRSLPLAPLLTAIPAFVVLFGFGMVAPDVLTTGNLWNIATQTSYLAIFTLGQTIVLLTAGLDLSIGMAVSYTSVVAALALVNVAAPGLAILAYLAAGVGLGLVIGAVNGFFVAIVGINPFIVTLGTYNILLALSSTVTGGFPFPASHRSQVSSSSTHPSSAYRSRSSYPRSSWRSLDSSYGAPYSGAVSISLAPIPAWRPPRAFGSGCTRWAPISCAPVLARSAACFSARAQARASRISAAVSRCKLSLPPSSAGARLRGGKGGVLSALLGAFFITVLSNGMNLARIDGYVQQLCIGAIIILALLAEQISQNAERSN